MCAVHLDSVFSDDANSHYHSCRILSCLILACQLLVVLTELLNDKVSCISTGTSLTQLMHGSKSDLMQSKFFF